MEHNEEQLQVSAAQSGVSGETLSLNLGLIFRRTMCLTDALTNGKHNLIKKISQLSLHL